MTPGEDRQLLGRLFSHIAPDTDPSTLEDDDPLQETLDLDSMDFLNLMEAVGESTGLEVPERDDPLVTTIGSFVTYPAFAEHLVRLGIDAISVDADAVGSTRRVLAAGGKRVLLEGARR